MRYLLFVTVLWAFSFNLIGEYLAGQVDSYFAVLTRVLLAGLVFLPLTRWRGVEPRFVGGVMLVGALQFGITYVCLYLSFNVLTVPEVLLFTVLTPVHVALFDDLLNRRFNFWALAAALVAVLGAAIIRYDGITGEFLQGFLLLQLANATFAAGQVLYKRLVRKYPSELPQRQRFGYFFVGALLVALPAWLLFGDPQRLPTGELQWGVLVWMGLLATALGQFWWNKGATEVDAGTLAVMNNLHVPVGLLLNLLIWNQHADLPRLALGGAVIVASLWVNRLVPARGACMRISGQGVLLSLAASVLFVTLPGYVHLLEPLDSLQVVAHRVVWSIPMVFLLVVATRQWPTLRAAWRRLFAEPWLLACFPLTAAMMLLQWGIFIWAPLAGKTLELSLGYFLLPLAMVLVGRVFYGERLTPLQAIAVACALAGVLHEFWLTRAFSWVSLVTALGYPPYFMLRRRMGVDALSGFVFEMLFLLPLALAALYWLGDESQAFREAPRLWLLLPMLGLISALAFGAMMASSRLLPMGLFGILSYVEPVLLFLVAVLFLGEAFRPEQLWTYAPIWLAVLLTGWDSARLLRKQARRGI